MKKINDINKKSLDNPLQRKKKVYLSILNLKIIDKIVALILLPFVILLSFEFIIKFSISGLVVDIIFVALFIVFLIDYWKIKQEKGSKCLVLDCEVYKIETNPGLLGIYNVRIKDSNGNIYKDFFGE